MNSCNKQAHRPGIRSHPWSTILPLLLGQPEGMASHFSWCNLDSQTRGFFDCLREVMASDTFGVTISWFFGPLQSGKRQYSFGRRHKRYVRPALSRSEVLNFIGRTLWSLRWSEQALPWTGQTRTTKQPFMIHIRMWLDMWEFKYRSMLLQRGVCLVTYSLEAFVLIYLFWSVLSRKN